MIGPNTIRAAITTMATKTRIKAYSTRPCPFSFKANNMLTYLLSLGFPDIPVGIDKNCTSFTTWSKEKKACPPDIYVSFNDPEFEHLSHYHQPGRLCAFCG